MSEIVPKEEVEENGSDVEDENPNIHFEPLVNLPEIDVKTLEEGLKNYVQYGCILTIR